MSLTKEQKRELDRLTQYFRKIEKLALEGNIALDDFVIHYTNEVPSVYKTEQTAQNPDRRKEVFEKAGKEKTQSKKYEE
jgi:hypothetical protein